MNNFVQLEDKIESNNINKSDVYPSLSNTNHLTIPLIVETCNFGEVKPCKSVETKTMLGYDEVCDGCSTTMMTAIEDVLVVGMTKEVIAAARRGRLS
jgi:hypothetical protein